MRNGDSGCVKIKALLLGGAPVIWIFTFLLADLLWLQPAYDTRAATMAFKYGMHELLCFRDTSFANQADSKIQWRGYMCSDN